MMEQFGLTTHPVIRNTTKDLSEIKKKNVFNNDLSDYTGLWMQEYLNEKKIKMIFKEVRNESNGTHKKSDPLKWYIKPLKGWEESPSKTIELYLGSEHYSNNFDEIVDYMKKKEASYDKEEFFKKHTKINEDQKKVVEPLSRKTLDAFDNYPDNLKKIKREHVDAIKEVSKKLEEDLILFLLLALMENKWFPEIMKHPIALESVVIKMKDNPTDPDLLSTFVKIDELIKDKGVQVVEKFFQEAMWSIIPCDTLSAVEAKMKEGRK